MSHAALALRRVLELNKDAFDNRVLSVLVQVGLDCGSLRIIASDPISSDPIQCLIEDYPILKMFLF